MRCVFGSMCRKIVCVGFLFLGLLCVRRIYGLSSEFDDVGWKGVWCCAAVGWLEPVAAAVVDDVGGLCCTESKSWKEVAVLCCC